MQLEVEALTWPSSEKFPTRIPASTLSWKHLTEGVFASGNSKSCKIADLQSLYGFVYLPQVRQLPALAAVPAESRCRSKTPKLFMLQLLHLIAPKISLLWRRTTRNRAS